MSSFDSSYDELDTIKFSKYYLFCIDQYNQLIYQSLPNQHLCLCCVFDPQQKTFHSNIPDFAVYRIVKAL